MSGPAKWLVVLVALGSSITSVPSGGRGDGPAGLRKPAVAEVIKSWSPELKSATEYGRTGGSPKQSPNVASYSFKVVGPTFEELWNHYASLCGLKDLSK